MKCLNDFHLQNQRFMSISMADGFRCISLAKSRMRESRMSGSVRGCSLRGQSTRPEELKAADQMKWVQMRNNIQHRAEEFILHDYIFV